MTIEDRLFFLFVSIVTGIFSAVFVIYLKNRFDIKREERAQKRVTEEILAYMNLDKTCDPNDEQEPLIPLLRFRKNALRELKKSGDWDEKTLSIWTAYLETDKQLLEWAKHQEELARITAKNLVALKRPNA